MDKKYAEAYDAMTSGHGEIPRAILVAAQKKSEEMTVSVPCEHDTQMFRDARA